MSQEWKLVPVELLNRAVMAIINTSQMHPALEDLQAMIDAPAPPQGDAQPVAWLNVATGCVTTSSVQVMDWDDEKEEVKSLYTHADAGEVERLNTVVEQQKNLITSLRAELVESHSLTDDSLRAQLADTEQSRRSWFDLSQDLEKRLAERDALAVRLTEAQADSHELFGDRELFAAQRDKARNLLKRAENFVSEIAATGRPGAIELESDIRSLYLPIDAEHVRPEFVFSDSPDGCAAEAKFLRSLKAESSQHD